MKYLILFFTVACSLFSISEETIAEAIKKALDVRQKAYAPYSNYKVGSAIVTKQGKIISGCNVENASYGLVNCAERTAIFKSISKGQMDFDLIVVATKDGGLCCGACRQVLNEFNPNIRVIAVNETGEITIDTYLEQLLPKSFGPHNLQ